MNEIDTGVTELYEGFPPQQQVPPGLTRGMKPRPDRPAEGRNMHSRRTCASARRATTS